MPFLKRPSPQDEFERIQQHYPRLSSTGCTRAFCQAGRMVHTDEPKVGNEPDYEAVELDAVDFLQQLRRDGVITSDEALQKRLNTARSEIRSNSVAVEGASGSDQTTLPGHWNHSFEELEHGIRLSWKHSRKCIMRSEYGYLKLNDLRHITTSKEMGQAIIAGMHKAFNNGDIQPSVFVFSPKKANQPGPMVWNQQLLAFAGYEQPDKSILGDPMSVKLTEAIISLGWKPPAVRTRWDLLPLVTMMDGDEPCITPIPPEFFPIVQIRHPQPEHSLAFEKMALRWVPAPALSQMGFDIGGVQYTAAPFIGWFMDAEIGVRDLADSFRYDALPSVVSALKLLPPDQELDELPQSETLALLSRAQSELNHAVHWSFTQAGVRMSDSLTASAMYTNFDDNHLATHGFRLPADPYWISPPEGSIVPIWHRGAAPNYQPKPMICRLSQNPIRVWQKRQGKTCPVMPKGNGVCPAHASGTWDKSSPTTSDWDSDTFMPTIRIFYCSSGTTAQRLATKLHQRIADIIGGAHEQFVVAPIAVLNELEADAIADGDIVFVMASSSGHGDVPVNGHSALQKLKSADNLGPTKAVFNVFGNGNSSYGDNFNGAAIKIQTAMEKIGLDPGVPLFQADTLKEDPPWRQFNSWLALVKGKFGATLDDDSGDLLEEEEAEDDSFELLLSQLSPAKIISVQAPGELGMKRVALDVGKLEYGALSHIDVVVPLERKEVEELLWATRFSGEEEFSYGEKNMSTRRLLSLADPEAPFKSLQWINKLQMEFPADKAEKCAASHMGNALKDLPVGWQAKAKAKTGHYRHFFASLPIKQMRTFSAASSPSYWDMLSMSGVLELLVQTHAGGQFTERFLSKAIKGDELYLRVRNGPGEHLIHEEKPLIAFTTGSGIAPLRGLLQAKCAHILERDTESDSAENDTAESISKSPISLFLGYSPGDSDMITESLRDAQDLGFLDIVSLTPSNPKKERAQDKLFQEDISNRIRTKIQDEGANVFVCASRAAVDDFARNLEAVLGVDSIRESLGERWVEEVYVFKS